jgi:hypothetical protein|tara:strand:- start:109 stop:315 length:207 start_codon:yes stop_codon:yes gene_type:complete
MRGKTVQEKSDDNGNGYKTLLDTTEKRLNVNNILRRIENEKKEDKRFNLLIFSGVTVAVLIFLFLLSL